MKTEPEPVLKPRKKLIRQRTGYGPVAAVAVMILTYVLSQIFAATFVGFGADILGYNAEEVLSNLGSSSRVQFIYLLLVEAFTLYVIWLFLKVRAVPWKDIGLGRLPAGKDFIAALKIFGIYFVSLIFITWVITELVPTLDTGQKQQLGFENAALPSELVLVFISLVILPPIVEEIMIRGFLYTGLRANYTKVW